MDVVDKSQISECATGITLGTGCEKTWYNKFDREQDELPWLQIFQINISRLEI